MNLKAKQYKKIMNKLIREHKNKMKENSILPDEKLKGNIIPIYKQKGAQGDQRNYRPITILSCMDKLFTSILNNRLNVLSKECIYLVKTKPGLERDILQQTISLFYIQL